MTRLAILENLFCIGGCTERFNDKVDVNVEELLANEVDEIVVDSFCPFICSLAPLKIYF